MIGPFSKAALPDPFVFKAAVRWESLTVDQHVSQERLEPGSARRLLSFCDYTL